MIETIEVTFTDGETQTVTWEEDAWETEDRRAFGYLDLAIAHAHELHDEQFSLQRKTLTRS